MDRIYIKIPITYRTLYSKFKSANWNFLATSLNKKLGKLLLEINFFENA